MNWPYGLTVDNRGRIWVAELTKTPKRISVWSATGRLLQAFYGPSQYGGGGTVDPVASDETLPARADVVMPKCAS